MLYGRYGYGGGLVSVVFAVMNDECEDRSLIVSPGPIVCIVDGDVVQYAEKAETATK